VAVGLETIRRSDPTSLKQSIARLAQLIEAYNIKNIVLGYPKNMNNTEGIRCEMTLRFKAKLERSFTGVEVTLWDERLSTVAVLRGMKGRSIAQKRESVDTMAAAYILQGYLDLNQRGENDGENG
jgi:putative Holliday junction resolvase